MPSKRLLPLAAAVGLTLAAAACQDDTLFEASLNTTPITPFEVYALTGAGPGLPSAYSAVRNFGDPFSSQIRRVDSLDFDVAFDITPGGQISLYPLRTLGQPLSGRSVGIRVDSSVAFGDLQRAPVRGYVRDSVVTFAVGRTVVLETPFAGCGPYSLSQNVYTKLVVDSANLGTRKIFFRAVNNPNCGFRSLRPDARPKD